MFEAEIALKSQKRNRGIEESKLYSFMSAMVMNRTIVHISSLGFAGEDINVFPAFDQCTTQAGNTWFRCFVREVISSVIFC